MIFVSGAPVVLKKKVSIARQRMFLFADNVEPPQSNTANYPLVWGMMPIVGQTPNDPMYAVIMKAEEDFEQTGLATPGVKPVMQMKQLPELEMRRKYLM